MHHTPTPLLNRLLFFTHTAPYQTYTLSLHDALPICTHRACVTAKRSATSCSSSRPRSPWPSSASAPRSSCTRASASIGCCSKPDRKSTRLNSSHANISYAVFCLKKKKKHTKEHIWTY